MFRTALVSAVMLAALGAATTALAQNQPAASPIAAAPAAKPDHPVIKPGDRNCIRDTGSLIPAKPGHCQPVNGRSYSQQDIRNTGETRLGPALEKLDPSITTHGH